jgi:ubiquinone/menaquinone biosynthesis C-methylase UbiE
MQLTDIVHQYLDKYLQPGALAIDATAGNGYDALKMAERVGSRGKVIAIDIQQAAIQATEQRLNDAGWTHHEIIEGDHASVLQNLSETHPQAASAITFNLGYLPGSDKCIRTTPESTSTALDAAALLLKEGGVLLVVAYRGHSGGMDEATLVKNWMHAKQTTGHTIKTYEPQATERIPPILWVLTKTD